MKRIIVLLGCSILAASMAVAQDSTSSAASGAQDQSAQTQSHSSARQTSIIRGCLSGSSGNYTVTDPNGMQYEVNGDDNTLRSMVGREVEITVEGRTMEDATESGSTATHTTNTVQASNVKAVASSCGNAGRVAPSGNSHPEADERPEPQMMSMLQPQSAPGQDQTQSGSASPVQSTPPVTSQTPANSASPTSGANSQAGTNPSNATSPSNNTGMTGAQVNQNAQAARQGQINTNPQSTQTGNQGTNNPAATNRSAMPTSPNSATPSNAQQPQGPCTKPLYECPATDVGNTGTPPPQQ